MCEPFIGEIRMVGFNFAPRGWALCNGQLMAIQDNPALFSLLGTYYGGDGRTTFGLPDLRGRVPLHQGRGPGLSNYQIGQKSGVEHVTLHTNQIPAHSHGAVVTTHASSGGAGETAPEDNVWAEAGDDIYTDDDPDVTMKSDAVQVSIQNTGGDQPHTNVQPYQCVNFVIALVGLYPSRS